ncbi:MAG: FAD-binding oxidoreductase, partial [Chloroflexi bacterium]|nr:FAD-binding oxidoreductase [Chloroflexota bacterium]
MTNPSRKTADAIIIGAGSIGVPLAFHLATRGLKTIVIEREASIGQGSNKRAIGGIRATHSDPAKIKICQRSIAVFSSWEEMYGEYRGGYCFVAYQYQEAALIENVVSEQQGYGLNICWLDRSALLDHVPDLNPEGLIGGSFSPDDGSASPLLAIQAFSRLAKQSRAVFVLNETVVGILQEGQVVKGVVTDRAVYEAPLVINCAGAWAAQVASFAGIDIPVTPDAHEAAVTEPVAHFLDPMIVDIQPSPGSSNFYFYQHATGQVFFCLTPHPNHWGFHMEETSEFLPMACKRLLKIMPRLSGLRVRRTWRGLYPMTPDGSPLVGWAGSLEGFFPGSRNVRS